MKIMLDGYGICSGVDIDIMKAHKKLIDDVLMRMDKGWIPQGGVCHVIAPTSPDATHIYTQAIVRPVE